MDLTNYKATIAYTSITDNTLVLAEYIESFLREKGLDVKCYLVEDLPLKRLNESDVFIVGTYTWGDGEIPSEMESLYEYLDCSKFPDMVTGVFGTGDTLYPKFCGAVDEFKLLLSNMSNLAVTLKVELAPQPKDIEKAKVFADKLIERLERG